MKKRFTVFFYISLFFLLTTPDTYAQKKNKTKDMVSIMAMCGCFNVTFNFAETFSPDQEYDIKENYNAKGLEYVFPIFQGKNKIMLQHLLIMPTGKIIKHWRQDWVYENTNFYLYNRDYRWNYADQSAKSVKGQWTQKVYQVDDGPRYEGSASWVYDGEQAYWESVADAPLPRREVTKDRHDYNVMTRRNRHAITSLGWVHEQDNNKVIRKNAEDKILVREKGWNTYNRTDEKKCVPAKQWWSEHKDYWQEVRAVWHTLFATKKTIVLHMKVEDELLYERIFALEKQAHMKEKLTSKNSVVVQEEIRKIIEEHVNLMP